MNTAIDFANEIRFIDSTTEHVHLGHGGIEYVDPSDPYRDETGIDYVYSRYLDALVKGIQSQWRKDTEHVNDTLGEEISNPVAYFGLADQYLALLESLKVSACKVALAMPETG